MGKKVFLIHLRFKVAPKFPKTVEEVLVFFADVGLMRRETPLLMGGGLITDICGMACSLYRRSTAYVRLPTTLIGMIDAAIAIKVLNLSDSMFYRC